MLNLMPTIFFIQVRRGTTKDRKLCKSPETAVWNIPHVKGSLVIGYERKTLERPSCLLARMVQGSPLSEIHDSIKDIS